MHGQIAAKSDRPEQLDAAAVERKATEALGELAQAWVPKLPEGTLRDQLARFIPCAPAPQQLHVPAEFVPNLRNKCYALLEGEGAELAMFGNLDRSTWESGFKALDRIQELRWLLDQLCWDETETEGDVELRATAETLRRLLTDCLSYESDPCERDTPEWFEWVKAALAQLGGTEGGEG